jgi:hypothetical protein
MREPIEGMARRARHSRGDAGEENVAAMITDLDKNSCDQEDIGYVKAAVTDGKKLRQEISGGGAVRLR